MKNSFVALIAAGIAALVSLAVYAAQAPTYTQGPDSLARVDIQQTFNADGTVSVCKAVATFQVTIVNTSDPRDTSVRKVGELEIDLAYLFRQLWAQKHPPVFTASKATESRMPPTPAPSTPAH